MPAAAKPRTPISGPRQTGTIAEWKGEFGWIKPSKPINHPQASKRGGKIYLGVDDVVEELEGIGATVSFTLYSDSTGLGAADVKPAKGSVAKTGAAAANGKPATSSAVAAYKEHAKKTAELKAKGVSTKGTGFSAGFNKQPAAKAAAKAPAFARSAPYGQAYGQAAAKKPKTGSAPEAGGRESLHDEPLLGTVCQWKGQFGWITPHDTIEHPLANKHKGDIYFAVEDVEEEIEGVGATIQFMLYGDGKGLGASNVRPAE